MPGASKLRMIAAIVPATNMNRTLQFFEALGFAARLYRDGSQYAFLQMDGNDIHVRKADKSEFSLNPGGMYLYVDDVESFYARVVSNGLTPLSEPQNYEWKMREFALSDPDGLLIRIGQNLS
jgi:catechol 2,3-dioxygenase-like lactoylglutathione lyase family enzyme